MGSKNLKAVVVVGMGAVKVADPKGFHGGGGEGPGGGQAAPGGRRRAQGLRHRCAGEHPQRDRGAAHPQLPGRPFPHRHKVGGESLSEKLLVRPKGCYSCVISCGRVTKCPTPKYMGEGEGPEYEAAWCMGPDCGIDDLEAIVKTNFLCNEYGLDSITLGATIACGMDLFEAGHVTLKDTGGVDMSFGNRTRWWELTRLIGNPRRHRRQAGPGLLPVRRRLWPSGIFHDRQEAGDAALRPARRPGHRAGICTSNRGGCHVRGYTIAVEVLGNGAKLDPHVTARNRSGSSCSRT